jgi:hypothetical protein
MAGRSAAWFCGVVLGLAGMFRAGRALDPWMYGERDILIARGPAEAPGDPDVWFKGQIQGTITGVSGIRLHVVEVKWFRWDQAAEWVEYDGVPLLLFCDKVGSDHPAECIDTWPRRGEKLPEGWSRFGSDL